MRAQWAFSKRVRDKANEANQSVIAIRRVKSQLENRLKRSDDATLKSTGATLKTSTSAVEENVYQVRNQSGQDPLNFPIKVNNRLATLLSMAERGDGRPTNNMPEIFGILSSELKQYTDRLGQIWKTDLAAVNKELARLNLHARGAQANSSGSRAPTRALGALQQHNPGQPAVFLPRLGGEQTPDDSPEACPGHLALQALRFFQG
jgi:hypothetical protein